MAKVDEKQLRQREQTHDKLNKEVLKFEKMQYRFLSPTNLKIDRSGTYLIFNCIVKVVDKQC